jgi:ParB-like nuclease domain
MVVRLKGGKLVLRQRQRAGHNSPDDFTDLERFIRSQRIEFWPTEWINLPSRGLRQHSPRKLAALRRAIATFGVFVPVIVDPDGVLLAGEARLACAKELRLVEVPVLVVSHLTETEKRLFTLADNRIPELSTWDLPALKIEVQELSLDHELDLSLTGFDTAETDRIIGVVPDETNHADDSLPELDASPVSRNGDLWILEHHKVYCGSALDTASFEALLGRERAQMVITDPPFNVSISGHVRNSKTSHREFLQASGEMNEAEFSNFLSAGSSNKRNVCARTGRSFTCSWIMHIHSNFKRRLIPYSGNKRLSASGLRTPPAWDRFIDPNTNLYMSSRQARHLTSTTSISAKRVAIAQMCGAIREQIPVPIVVTHLRCTQPSSRARCLSMQCSIARIAEASFSIALREVACRLLQRSAPAALPAS